MGRMIPIYNPEAVDPPDQDPGHMVCPICGARLHYDDIYYVITERGYRKIIACQYCIDELAEFVQEE